MHRLRDALTGLCVHLRADGKLLTRECACTLRPCHVPVHGLVFDRISTTAHSVRFRPNSAFCVDHPQLVREVVPASHRHRPPCQCAPEGLRQIIASEARRRVPTEHDQAQCSMRSVPWPLGWDWIAAPKCCSPAPSPGYKIQSALPTTLSRRRTCATTRDWGIVRLPHASSVPKSCARFLQYNEAGILTLCPPAPAPTLNS